MHVELIRDETGGAGTFGTLGVYPDTDTSVEPTLRLQTVEQPWRDNKPYQSCIPAGEYWLVPYDSPRHGQTWAIVGGNVGFPETDPHILRSECLFHVANWADQVQGCIGPGMGRAIDPARGPMVTSSRAALAELKQAMSVEEIHTLTIRWGW